MPPVLNPVTELNQSLRDLPPPTNNVVVAVYGFTDQTGQMKPSDSVQTLSKAVTQGATAVLIKALQDSGNGSWFTIVERERLDNLLKERRIVQEMRKTYLGEENLNPQALPALLFAGILLEGGIIGYDTNLQTGGIGARLLGIGGDLKYRLDTVTVALRAVSTKTGQVLASVTTHKAIASLSIQGGVFRYIAVDKILEGEVGFTKNEPDQLAVQQAIEKAVYALVLEGADQKLWSFGDKALAAKLLRDYREEQFGTPQAATSHAEPIASNEARRAASDTKVAVVPAEPTLAVNSSSAAAKKRSSAPDPKPPAVPAKTAQSTAHFSRESAFTTAETVYGRPVDGQ